MNRRSQDQALSHQRGMQTRCVSAAWQVRACSMALDKARNVMKADSGAARRSTLCGVHALLSDGGARALH